MDAYTWSVVYLFENLSLPVTWRSPSPLTDERNVPPLNRIGDPDDILASVRVENGKAGPPFAGFSRVGLTDRHFYLQILAETYQAMPSYRLCTAHGVTQLTEGLASKLQGLLEVRSREESRTADS